MSIINNPAEPVRFVPAGQDELPEEQRVVYLLKVPTVWDRISFESQLAARGARQYSLAALIARARGIYAGMESGGPAEVVAMLDDFAAFLREMAATIRKHDASTEEGQNAILDQSRRLGEFDATLAPFFDAVAEIDPVYARMRADNVAYPMIAAAVAAKKFILGWENLPVEFRRGSDGLPDDLLGRIPEGDMLQVSARLKDLLRPSETSLKNSVSPSSGAGITPSSEMAQAMNGSETMAT